MFLKYYRRTTGFEPANGGVTIHCLTTWLRPPKKLIGADSGNRTRTSCLEGKGTTTMQYPLIFIIKYFFQNKRYFFLLFPPVFILIQDKTLFLVVKLNKKNFFPNFWWTNWKKKRFPCSILYTKQYIQGFSFFSQDFVF